MVPNQMNGSCSVPEPVVEIFPDQSARISDEIVGDVPLEPHGNLPSKVMDVISSLNGSELCPICLEQITEPAVVHRCSHLFCKNCIYRWLGSNIRCPYCRKRVSSLFYDKNGRGVYEKTRIDRINPNIRWDGVSNVWRQTFVDRFDFAGLTIRIYPHNALRFRQPSRSEIYSNRCRRFICRSERLPLDLMDHDRIRQWIRRDVEAIPPDANRSDINLHDYDLITDNLMKELVDSTQGNAINISRFRHTNLRALANNYFGRFAKQFLDEAFSFAQSGQSIENYDRQTYYINNDRL